MTTEKSITKQQARKAAAELNSVIHRCNLYHNMSRYINACAVVIDGMWAIEIENLQTGAKREFNNGGAFRDGVGRPVILDNMPRLYRMPVG